MASVRLVIHAFHLQPGPGGAGLSSRTERGQEREGPGGEGRAKRRRGQEKREGPGEGGVRRVEHNTGIHTQCPREHSWAHVHCRAGKTHL